MILKEARIRFSYLLSEKLLPYMRELGYDYAYDEVTQHQNAGHKKDSLHYCGCAADILLYLDGVYQTTTEAHQQAGEYWESLDPCCKWGGRFISPDGNHYSFSVFEIHGSNK